MDTSQHDSARPKLLEWVLLRTIIMLVVVGGVKADSCQNTAVGSRAWVCVGSFINISIDVQCGLGQDRQV